MVNLTKAYLEEIVKSRVSLQKEWGTHGQQPQQPEATKQTNKQTVMVQQSSSGRCSSLERNGRQLTDPHIYLLSPVSPPLLHPPTDNPDQLVELGMGQTSFS